MRPAPPLMRRLRPSFLQEGQRFNGSAVMGWWISRCLPQNLQAYSYVGMGAGEWAGGARKPPRTGRQKPRLSGLKRALVIRARDGESKEKIWPEPRAFYLH